MYKRNNRYPDDSAIRELFFFLFTTVVVYIRTRRGVIAIPTTVNLIDIYPFSLFSSLASLISTKLVVCIQHNSKFFVFLSFFQKQMENYRTNVLVSLTCFTIFRDLAPFCRCCLRSVLSAILLGMGAH